LKNASIYRKMFFNPKYGSLGMFILPTSLLTLFTALFLFSIMFWNLVIFLLNEFIKFKTIGIPTTTPSFDLFFVHTSSVAIITIILITLTITLMGIGKKMVKDPFFSFDILVYLALYGFIAPIWLTASIYKAFTSKSVRWRYH